jgi:urocanate hydratase
VEKNLPLALDPNLSTALDFLRQVERFYTNLMQATDAGRNAGNGQEPGLGGRLLYVGELDEAGRALMVAGNVAGAATLASTANPAAQKQAIRDGVADFLVTSLDEALRILKNEIRKRETVAVCVAAAPEAVEREMLERGVQPDLLGPGMPDVQQAPWFFGGRAKLVLPDEGEANQTILKWQVTDAPAQWMRKLDAIAMDCLGPDERAARRWLRLAPRYAGRAAQSVRVLRCQPETAKAFYARVQNGVTRGEIGVRVEISMTTDGEISLAEPSPWTAREGSG